MSGNGAHDYYGLRRSMVTAQEALDRRWADDADVVVVTDPPREHWANLQAAGFRIKPRWVTWGRRTPAHAEDFLAGLSKAERRNFRDVRRYVDRKAITIEVHARLTPELFAEFLTVYDAQLATMPHGLPAAHSVVATEAGLADYFFVSARTGDELTAGVVCRVAASDPAMRVAFSAARPQVRHAMISRALYLAAFEEARRRAFTWVSLGTDPTLYGHIVQAGLFTFKSRLGFVPVPLHHLDPDDDGCDEAELVLSTERLGEPALSLCYARPPDRLATWADPLPMRLDVLRPAHGLDLRPYHAPFVTETVVQPPAAGVAAGEVVVIVDPFSTGAMLAPAFNRQGRRCVAVLTGTINERYAAGLRRDDFLTVLTVRGESPQALDATAELLAPMRPVEVIAGSEWGVNVADDLAHLLGLPGNVHSADRPRREKPAMMEAVARAGLRVPLGARVGSVEDLDDFLTASRVLPVVVKPAASAGSEGVYFCADEAQARSATAKLLGATNAMGQPNDSLLVQEQLVGQQYFVNSVSLDGRHHIHEIWRDDRFFIEGRPVYDRQLLLDGTGETEGVLRPFVEGVLDALGVRTGPAHTELLVDDRGPVLIESGARLEGGVTPAGPERATGVSQLSLTVERYTDPERFARRIGAGYQRQRALMVVCLVAPYDGTVAEGAAQRLAEIPSIFCGTALDLVPGTPVHRTVDLFTSPGHLYLIADDPARLEEDYQRIRALEHNGLYESR
ncbi:ATP-grasp domain-containing protein [Micromonospora sp. WMMD1120]|uniref:ATP-grasp domain-containing protein n=1 Tax=Micromonospora sp. WMMD1120 TaxID=3016106 RepID=UPI002415C00D|nr:ATP-grasp domain-containing protein [Micromonospora sp. WMMD1120]MDG4806969.1 ATP-grasp domain-containing protein [Micromonospora sp. WMMD1120]